MTTPASAVIVVGAGLAGATAALTLRERGFDGDIVLVGAETELPYERPALTKTDLAGDVPLDQLLVKSADTYDEHRITLRLGYAATSLDLDRRAVTLNSGEVLPYTHLVIATGANNLRPPIPGIDLDGVHPLRTAADADAIRAELPGLRTAVVVGQGFIGCEVTATPHHPRRRGHRRRHRPRTAVEATGTAAVRAPAPLAHPAVAPADQPPRRQRVHPRRRRPRSRSRARRRAADRHRRRRRRYRRPAGHLLVRLRERRLDVTRPILACLDGSKALRRAVLDVFDKPLIQRCQLHKIRHVRDKPPQQLRPGLERRMRAAYHADSALAAEALLTALARELDKTPRRGRPAGVRAWPRRSASSADGRP